MQQLDRHDKRAVRAFIRLPFRLYADDPLWVPPLLPGERERFSDDYPFYTHSEAAFFLARRADGTPVGRIVVMEHGPHNAYRDKRDALLYMYEAIDDEAVAADLFGAAEGWARSRGLTRLVGPKGFLTAEGIGLLVDGFEHRPAVGIPYNPPYYARHWQQIGGLSKEVDYLSAQATRDGYEAPERILRLAKKIRERRGYHVPRFTSAEEIRAYVPQIVKAYNSAFADLWAYTPIPDEEVTAIVERITMLVSDPNLITLIFKGEELIGFQFAYPDVGPAIRWARGRMWPFGALAILWYKGRAKTLNVNGNAILPKYQGLGANAVLYEAMLNTMLNAKQFNTAELVQIEEKNAPMLADMRELIGSRIIKRHRVYTKTIS
jgi:hypothetical protein